MRYPPIMVSYGQQVLFRQFSDGNVILPMDSAERGIVADTLREILEMVDGDVTLPSFSSAGDANCSPQTAKDHGDHTFCAGSPLEGQPDNQTFGYSVPPNRWHPNDN